MGATHLNLTLSSCLFKSIFLRETNTDPDKFEIVNGYAIQGACLGPCLLLTSTLEMKSFGKS